MSTMADYKCMLLVPKDQYDQLKAAPAIGPAAGSNSVDSGIGGDVNDSNVQNIDVSEGGTIVINDRDKCGNHEHARDHTSGRVKVATSGGYPTPISVGSSSYSPNQQFQSSSPPPPRSSKSPTRSSKSPPRSTTPPPRSSPPPTRPSPPSSSAPRSAPPKSKRPVPQSQKQAAAATPPAPEEVQQRREAKKRKGVVRTRKKKPSPTQPQISEKASERLKTLVEKRVSVLGGQKPAKRRRKAASEGDLNRSVVHDLREASKRVEAAPPAGPSLAERRVGRYRAQIAKIRPYVDKIQEGEEMVQAAEAPPAKKASPRRTKSRIQPHRVPLPPSSSDEENFDPPANPLGRRIAKVGAARSRPRRVMYTSRRPQAVKRSEPVPDIKVDPFHYEPREKITNLRTAAVRHVGAFARKKRPVSKTEDQKRWERLSFPTKRTIRPEELPLPSDDEELGSDGGDEWDDF